MTDKKTIRLAMIGSGFAAATQMEALRSVHGTEVVPQTLCSQEPDRARLKTFMERHGFEGFTDSYEEVLGDSRIDAVSICTPTDSHMKIILDALSAGKHVLCEKPLWGICRPAASMNKRDMRAMLEAELAGFADRVRRAGTTFCYAENWIYTPAVLKMDAMLTKSGGQSLSMIGRGMLGGSHAAYATHWEKSGGGVLLRIGCHPLSALLFLKRRECERRGVPYSVTGVGCETAMMSPLLRRDGKKVPLGVAAFDVEDWAAMTLTFSDGSRAVVLSEDTALGGVDYALEVHADNLSLRTVIEPNGQLRAFVPDASLVDGIVMHEKTESCEGWQHVTVEDLIMRGYVAEMQDFAGCVATGRAPLSGIDLAVETLRLVYAAYQAAEEGCRVRL